MKAQFSSFSIFIVALVQIVFSRAYDYTSDTVGFELNAIDQKPIELQDKTVACPPTLQSWVKDDFTDQSSFGIKYKSETTVCQTPIESYEKYLKSHGSSSNFPEVADLSSYLGDRFKDKINPIFKTYLEKCSDFTSGQKKLAQVRLYNAAKKYESINSVTLDEIAYIDSVLPSIQGPLEGVACLSGSWPAIQDKCKKIQPTLVSCKESKEQRLSDLVKKTQEKIPQIEKLISLYHQCLQIQYNEPGARVGRGFSEKANKDIQEKCGPLDTAVELLKDEVPWIRGEQFQKQTVLVKPQPKNGIFKTEYDLSTDKVKNAISSQLGTNRQVLANNYSQNLTDFNCLISKKTSQENCEFENIRTRLLRLPDLVSLASPNNTIKDREADSYFDAEKCILERHEDRAQTQSIVDRSISDAVFTVATFGVGEGLVALRAVNIANKFSLIRHPLIFAAGGVQYGVASITAKGVIDACLAQQTQVIELTKKTDLVVENVCSTIHSPLAQAKEMQNNCVITALLATPGLVALPGLGRAVGAFASAFNPGRLAKMAPGDRSVEIIHWDSKGHFDLVVNGKLYGTSPKVDRGIPVNDRLITRMGQTKGNSNERFKISVTAEEEKLIEAGAIKFSKEYDKAKESTAGMLRHGAVKIWKGEGVTCAGTVCGILGEATGYYVPALIRDVPHMAAAYLKARKLIGDARIISIETNGKFDLKEYLKSQESMMIGTLGATVLIVKYLDKNGEIKEVSVKIEKPNYSPP